MNFDYEKELLGKIIIDNDIFFSLRLTDNMFKDERHRAIYKAISSLVTSKYQANIYEISKHLNYQGDIPYIASLTDNCYTSVNWEPLQHKIITEHKRSLLKKLSYEIASKLDSDPDETIEHIIKGIQDISTQDDSEHIVALSDLMLNQVKVYEQRSKLKGELPGIQSGIAKIDEKFLGFQKSRLYYLCARPSQGKSALMINMAVNIGINGLKVGIISLESARDELADRALSYKGKIDGTVLKTGLFRASDYHNIIDGTSELYEVNIMIYDKPNASMPEISQAARKMKMANSIDILFVDYLQLIRVPKSRERKEQVAEASMSLKALSRELKIPVVALAQLSRDSDDKRPQLGDIQWSSQAEQDADAVILMQDAGSQIDSMGRPTEMRNFHFYIDKNRDGAKGHIAMEFIGKFITFQECEYQPGEQVKDMQDKYSKKGKR